MRRKTLLAAIGMLSLALIAGSQSTASARGGSDPGLHVALGDSLAVGTGATNEARLGYVAHLFRYARIVSRNEINTLENLSVGGETSGTFLTNGQFAAALATINDPDSDTHVVTLDIGGDDLLPLLKQEPCATDPTGAACQGEIATQIAGFAGNFPTIVGDLQAALAADPGDERFLAMTYYNPFSGTGSPFEAPVDFALLGADATIDCTANQANQANIGLNDLISCIGAAAGVTIVDVYPAFQGRGAQLTHIAEQDVHPNNRGHFVIALQFIRASLR